jgi:hypothetical protein
VATTKPRPVPLDPPLAKEVVRVAKRQKQTALEFVSTAVRKHIDEVTARQKAWQRVQAYGRKRALSLGITSEEDVYRLMDEFRHGRSRRVNATPTRRR